MKSLNSTRMTLIEEDFVAYSPGTRSRDLAGEFPNFPKNREFPGNSPFLFPRNVPREREISLEFPRKPCFRGIPRKYKFPRLSYSLEKIFKINR